MDQDTETERRTKFFVHLAGPTLGAHQDIVSRLRRVGHTEVSCIEESDYLLVFCPIVSRVVSDIRAALHDISGEKPVILVVMHHTFNPEQVVGESSQQVTNRSVILTVDCLVYEGTFLACNRNDIAWREIQTCLRVSTSQISGQQAINCLRTNLIVMILVAAVALLVFIVIVIIVVHILE